MILAFCEYSTENILISYYGINNGFPLRKTKINNNDKET